MSLVGSELVTDNELQCSGNLRYVGRIEFEPVDLNSNLHYSQTDYVISNHALA